MKQFKGIIATSHVDRQGEAFAVSALQDMVDHINRSYLPVIVEHDPRRRPLGRLLAARLVEMSDGAVGLEAEGELYAPGETILPFDVGDKQLLKRSFDPARLTVSYDRGFQDAQSQAIIRELSDRFGTEPDEEFKKSVDPVTALVIAGGALYLSGFLNKAGSDTWDFVRDRLKRLFRSRVGREERLLIFHVALDERVDVKVILTNPTDADIDHFLSCGLTVVADLVRPHLSEPGLRELAVSYSATGCELLHGTREDAVPLLLRRR